MNKKVAFLHNHLCICIIWLAGMLAGMITVFRVGASVTPSLFGEFFMSTSFLSHLLASIFPIMLIYIGRWLENDYFIYTILFLNGLLFGFCSLYLSSLMDLPVYYVHLFGMFSQGCNSLLLLILAFGIMTCKKQNFSAVHYLVFPVSVMICLADYYIFLKCFRI